MKKQRKENAYNVVIQRNFIRRKLIILLTLLFVISCLCFFACSNEDNTKHIHTFSAVWTQDGAYHWHVCSGCDAISQKESHTPDYEVATIEHGIQCTVCGYEIAPKLVVEKISKQNWETLCDAIKTYKYTVEYKKNMLNDKKLHTFNYGNGSEELCIGEWSDGYKFTSAYYEGKAYINDNECGWRLYDAYNDQGKSIYEAFVGDYIPVIENCYDSLVLEGYNLYSLSMGNMDIVLKLKDNMLNSIFIQYLSGSVLNEELILTNYYSTTVDIPQSLIDYVDTNKKPN